MKSYVQLSKAWYGESNFKLVPGKIDEICINVDDEAAEIVISWQWINSQIVGCSIQMFEDSWSAFKKCPELFEALSKLENKDPSPDDVCALLNKLGFKDDTEVHEEKMEVIKALKKQRKKLK